MKKKLKDISFAILAGGKSSRFGSNKIFYLIDEKPMIDKIIETGTKLCDEIILAGDYDYSQFSVKNKIVSVRDEQKNIGPIGGIYSALKNTKKEKIIFTPADMPFLEHKTFIDLAESYKNNKGSYISINNKPEPLISIWNKNLIPEIEKFIAQKNFSVKRIIAELNFSVLNINSEDENINQDQFRNINYLSDLY